MTVSAENLSNGAHVGSEPPRPVREISVAVVFGPLSDLLVRAVLQPLRIPPPAVVLTHALVGLAAALLVHEGALVVAALLLQLRTLLDNADGRLARASGRVTLAGRYLDTEADLVVNAALFAALASATDAPWLALAGFLALTVLLSVDFNLAMLYRESRDRALEPPPLSGSRVERALARAYGLLFAPQDRLVRTLSARRLARIVDAVDPARRRAAEIAYDDRATVVVVANLGLSTQLLVLGVLLAAGVPVAYLWLVVAALGLLPILQLRRERLARRALLREPGERTAPAPPAS